MKTGADIGFIFCKINPTAMYDMNTFIDLTELETQLKLWKLLLELSLQAGFEKCSKLQILKYKMFKGSSKYSF